MKSVFFSYSHKDEALRDQLETHLAMLKRQGVIEVWHDRRLIAGDEIDESISQELQTATIILLLVSPDFLASEYCYGVEVRRAMERHASGEARVIPVILRPCDWQSAPFGKLLAAPTDGRPVTKWPNLDDAFLEITKAVRAAAGDAGRLPEPRPTPKQPPVTGASAASTAAEPRSSNLRLHKTFADHDKDRFLDEAFEFMARFFENSLLELAARNPGIDGDFKRVDATRFLAAIYRDGKNLARCQIRLGGLSGGITFSQGALSDNSFNESLSVEVGGEMLSLHPLGLQSYGRHNRESKLSHEGAAEYYWGLFIEPLQRAGGSR